MVLYGTTMAEKLHLKMCCHDFYMDSTKISCKFTHHVNVHWLKHKHLDSLFCGITMWQQEFKKQILLHFHDFFMEHSIIDHKIQDDISIKSVSPAPPKSAIIMPAHGMKHGCLPILQKASKNYCQITDHINFHFTNILKSRAYYQITKTCRKTADQNFWIDL